MVESNVKEMFYRNIIIHVYVSCMTPSLLSISLTIISRNIGYKTTNLVFEWSLFSF